MILYFGTSGREKCPDRRQVKFILKRRVKIKKVIRGEYTGYKARARQPFPALDPFREIIDGWLVNQAESVENARRLGHSKLIPIDYPLIRSKKLTHGVESVEYCLGMS